MGGFILEDFREIYEREFNTVWHICLAYMKNTADAEDALSETFLRFMRYCNKKNGAFADVDSEVRERKIRAWLLVTAGNVCKDMLKHWWRKREPIEDYEHMHVTGPYEPDYILEAVMNLPDKYKIPVYMYYYLGYDSAEIGDVLHTPKSTIRTYLSKARKMLKEGIESSTVCKEGGVGYES